MRSEQNRGAGLLGGKLPQKKVVQQPLETTGKMEEQPAS